MRMKRIAASLIALTMIFGTILVHVPNNPQKPILVGIWFVCLGLTLAAIIVIAVLTSSNRP